MLAGVDLELAQEPPGAQGPGSLQDVVERLEPFARFDGIDVAGFAWSSASHQMVSFTDAIGTSP